jgi:hypothetical protein
MLTRVLMVVAVVSSVGCGGLQVDMSKVVPPPAGSDEAIAAVVEFYGMRAPTVYWYGGAALNCGGGLAYTDQTGGCVRGDQEDGVVILAANGLPFSTVHNQWPVSDIPHELAHEASDQRGEGGCQDHDCHWYRTGGEGDQATQMLAEMGL